MEIRYLILARYAEFTPDNKLNLIGGDSDQFAADQYPYVHPMLIAAAKLLLSKEDAEREHAFRAVIVAEESGEIVAEGARGTIPRLTFPEGAPKLGTGLILPFKNTVFGKSGRYVVQLIIDDCVLAQAPFRVAPFSYYQRMAGECLET